MTEVTPEETLSLKVNKPMIEKSGDRLTGQEERYVIYRLRGMSPGQSAKAAGYKCGNTGWALEQRPRVVRALQHFFSQQMQNIQVTRDMLTVMLFEAHGHSANATEEVAAIRELGKMHGIYAQGDNGPVGPGMSVHITQNITKLERMSDSDLLKISAMDVDSLEPKRAPLLIENDAK